MKEFRRLDDLVKFVLSECSGIKYGFNPAYFDKYGIVIKDGYYLILLDDFNIERVYYLDMLMKKHFGQNITMIKANKGRMKEGWLEKIDNLKLINISKNSIIPKLPDSLIGIIQHKEPMTIIREDRFGEYYLSRGPERITDIFENKRILLDMIEKGEIIV